jgi:hypothetical protein
MTWVAIVYPSSGSKWGAPSFDIDFDFLGLDDDEKEGEGEGWIRLRSRISGVFGSIDESRWVITIVSYLVSLYS